MHEYGYSWQYSSQFQRTVNQLTATGSIIGMVREVIRPTQHSGMTTSWRVNCYRSLGINTLIRSGSGSMEEGHHAGDALPVKVIKPK